MIDFTLILHSKPIILGRRPPRRSAVVGFVQAKLMPLLILPLPEDYIDDVGDILRGWQKKIEEPLFMILLEIWILRYDADQLIFS